MASVAPRARGSRTPRCVQIAGCLVVARGSARCLVVHPASAATGQAGGAGWWPPWREDRRGNAQDVANLVVASEGLGGDAPPLRLDLGGGGKLHIVAGQRVLVVLITAESGAGAEDATGGASGGRGEGAGGAGELEEEEGRDEDDDARLLQALGGCVQDWFCEGHRATLDDLLPRLEVEAEAKLKSSTARDVQDADREGCRSEGAATLDEFESFHGAFLGPLLARPVTRRAVERMRAVSTDDSRMIPLEQGSSPYWETVAHLAGPPGG